MVSEVPAFALAGLTAGGGITGYLRTGSLPSLIAGTVIGALYALGGYRIATNKRFGIELALLASIILAGSSIPRAIKTQKPLPIGIDLLVSGRVAKTHTLIERVTTPLYTTLHAE